MNLRPDQLAAHLAKGVQPLYTIHGDEPLLAQEAGDAIRAAARTAGYSERKVFTVGNAAHFDWDGFLGASQSMSLFAERQLIELRIPNGKPGKDGSEALQRYCEALSDDVVTLIHLPKLDWQQAKSGWFSALDMAGVMLKVDAVERRELPAWIAKRLAAQGQRVADGEEGQRTLAFFADRVEGNLLAAHQGAAEAGAAAPARHPGLRPGRSRRAQRRALRRLQARRGGARRPGGPRAAHARRARSRGRRRGAGALDAGRGYPCVEAHQGRDDRGQAAAAGAQGSARPGVPRSACSSACCPRWPTTSSRTWVQAASVCDGVIKGLKHPEWPLDPWSALKRLVLLTMQLVTSAPAAPRGPPPQRLSLVLEV